MGRLQLFVLWLTGLTTAGILVISNINNLSSGEKLTSGSSQRLPRFRSVTSQRGRLRIPQPIAHLTEYQWKILSCTGFTPRIAQYRTDNLTRLREQLLVPKLNFLPNYKNPCIRNKSSHQETIQCFPYFYIPGQPKSGTTDLYAALKKIPNIALPGNKEPGWWTRRRLGYISKAGTWQTMKRYTSTFLGPAKKIKNITINSYHPVVTGDLSTCYFSGNDRWPLYPGNEGLREPKYVDAHFIKSLTPHAKIIVSLRNPVDRLYSQYFQNAKRRNFTLSPEAFHEAAVDAVDIMTKCLGDRGTRECLYDFCVNSFDTMKVRLRDSMYSVFLKDWLKVFPREQMLIVSFEEYAAERAPVVAKIMDFLGMGQMTETSANEVNNLYIRNKRSRKNQVGPMLNETRHLLQEFLKPFNEELMNILQDDRFRYNRV